MSYITDRIQFIRDSGISIPLQNVRPEAKLKSYESCTDTRCWNNEVEERRQHILALMSTTPKTFSLATCRRRNSVNLFTLPDTHALDNFIQSYNNLKLGRYVSADVLLYLLASKNVFNYNEQFIEEMRTSVKLLEQDIEQKKQEIGRLKGKLKAVQQDLEERDYLLKVCEGKLQDVEGSLNGTIGDVEDHNQKLRNEIRNLHQRLDQHQIDLKRKKQEVENLRCQITQVGKRNSDEDLLRNENEYLKQIVQEVQESFSNEMAKQQTNGSKKEQLIAKSQELTKANKALETEIAKLQISLADMDAELKVVLSAKMDLEQELNVLRMALQTAENDLDALKTLVETLEQENNALKATKEQNNSLTESNRILSEENSSLKASISVLEEGNASLKERNTYLDEKISKLNEHQRTHEEENSSLKQLYSTLIEEAVSLKANNEMLSQEITSLKIENISLQENNNALKEDNSSLKDSTVALNKENNSLNATINSLGEENSLLKEKISVHARNNYQQLENASNAITELKQQNK